MTKVPNKSHRKKHLALRAPTALSGSERQKLPLVRRNEGRSMPKGERVLRAKIDMAHDNMLMRDPVIYQLKFVEHTEQEMIG